MCPGAVAHDHQTTVLRIPHPTPPPWCSDTQVAPPATFNTALSSAQSLTASLPSCMASVSRLGEATEALSRWSPLPLRSQTKGDGGN